MAYNQRHGPQSRGSAQGGNRNQSRNRNRAKAPTWDGTLTYQRHPSEAKPRNAPQAASRAENAPKPQIKPPQPPSGGLFSAKLVIAIFFVFVFVYIGHSIWTFWTPSVDTMVLRMSTVDSPQSVMGIIVRDEQVYNAERGGQIEFMVPDNDWVRVGALVANVSDPYMAEAATVRLNDVEDQAMDIQSRRQPLSIVDTEVQRLNNSLGNITSARVHNFSTLNLSEIYSLHDQLTQVINNRNQINIGDGVASMGLLAREQDRHMTVLGYNSRNMYAATSGIMSRMIDGMEATLTRASISSLTREDVQVMIDYDTFITTQEVQEGDGAFKIVGNVWYIAAEMPNSMITGFSEGTNRTVYLHNANTGMYEPHSLRIQSIDYGTRYSLVIFRSTRHVIDFLNQRNVSIRTTTGVQNGLKIPCTAISSRQYLRIPVGYIHGELDPFVSIFTEAGNSAVFVTVAETTDYNVYVAPVAGLGLGSLLAPNNPYDPHILLTEEHLHELHGIYLVRLGAAEFRVINLGDDGVDVGYILLDPALNPGINEFANVVIDASTVVDGQLIR